LGAGSVVCIDEFDDFGETKHNIIYEVVEQQIFNTATAGTHASPNRRYSVLGVAIPVHMKYDQKRCIQKSQSLAAFW